jgi:alcohol dehydrogenase
MNFSYFMPTRFFFGSGELSRLHERNLPGKKALVVTTAGGSAKKYGYLQKLTDQLDLAGVTYTLFDKILANPIVQHVAEGAALAKSTGCDFIIGLGGGSSIDSAKSIAVMATNDGEYWDYIGGGSGKGRPVTKAPLPVVAITTTAGTGTEADPWTVITNGEEKIGFGIDGTFPVLSIIDPELMVSVPPHLTAYQGLDAFFHSSEGYINNIANPMSDIFALKSIALIGKSLPAAVKNGADIGAREDVALANTLGGLVESTSSCTSQHSMAHALSALRPEIPHGAALSMVCIEYFTFIANTGKRDQRLVDMARALGKKDASVPMDFIEALSNLLKACGADTLRMSDYDIAKDDLPAFAENTWETMGGLFDGEPIRMTIKDTLGIFERSYQ